MPVRIDSARPDGSAQGTLMLSEVDLAAHLAAAPRPKFQELTLL
ncbi:MAG: hypothetical protein QM758_02915 [Armatimonas sp.]